MTLPVNEPFNEIAVTAKTLSVGTTPTAAFCAAPAKGRIARTYAVLEGTITTAPAAITVSINGGADIGTGALTLAVGGAGTAAADAPANSGGNAQVQEGDVIAFTPAGATGVNIPATFVAVIRKG
jgi:hypothetical protein